jgi:hypothetical protein
MPEWQFEWNQITFVTDLVGPQDVDSYRALELLQELAIASRSKFYETPAGTFVMKKPGARGMWNDFTVGTLHECAIIDSRQWQVSAGDVVNHVTVAGLIGSNLTDFEPRERTAQDAASIAAYGYKHQHIDTKLIDSEDSPVFPRAVLQNYANDVVADWRVPRWSLPQVDLDCNELDARDPWTWSDLMVAEPWSIVTIPSTTITPIDSGSPTDFYLMGWREEWQSPTTPGGPARHTMTLALGRRLRAEGDSAAVLQILAPVGGTLWQGVPWPLRVRVLDVETGAGLPGVTVTASIAGPNTAGDPATTGPDGAATIGVPAVDAPNVTVNVTATGAGLPTGGLDASARYTLTDPGDAMWANVPPAELWNTLPPARTWSPPIHLTDL